MSTANDHPSTPSGELSAFPFHDSPGGEMTERYERARAALVDWECRDHSPDDVELNQAAVALLAILDLHKPVTVYTPTPHCRVCGSLPWPCDSARIVLDAVLGGTP